MGFNSIKKSLIILGTIPFFLMIILFLYALAQGTAFIEPYISLVIYSLIYGVIFITSSYFLDKIPEKNIFRKISFVILYIISVLVILFTVLIYYLVFFPPKTHALG